MLLEIKILENTYPNYIVVGINLLSKKESFLPDSLSAKICFERVMLKIVLQEKDQ